MSTELIVRSELEKSNSGEVFIPRSKLVSMPWQELENANQAIMQFIADNPDYEFTSMEEILLDGITIRWRKIS